MITAEIIKERESFTCLSFVTIKRTTDAKRFILERFDNGGEIEKTDMFELQFISI